MREVVEAAIVTQRGSRCSRPVLLLATLDVKNAFNSLRWNDVLNPLEYTFSVPHYILSIISSCLSNRQLMCNKDRDQGLNILHQERHKDLSLAPNYGTLTAMEF